MHIADISLWMEQLGAGSESETNSQLPGDRQYDIAIVGGGYSGLWTAYYLKTLAPDCSICVLEAQCCGFGASGRNGGWLMAAIEGEAKLLSTLEDSRAEQVKQLIHSIHPEVEAVLSMHGIECDYQRSGGIYAAARYSRQLHIQRDALAELHQAGFTEEDFRWMDASELSSRLSIRNGLGAIYTPHIARIQPAKLALGLASTVRALGVDVFEQSPVLRIEGNSLVTGSGTVTAGVRVLATEGYGGSLQKGRPQVLPVQSRIVATEPLSDAQWSELGLAQSEVFCDASPLVTYGQRSADNRLVFGSRGAYRFGGRSRSDFSSDDYDFEQVQALLLDCFPQLSEVAITHRWGGTLGASRSGVAHAVFDRATGLATLSGYYGEGVGATNLMARTLADMVLQRDTELAQAPWAILGDPSSKLRRWEPEPLRWLGYKATSWVRAMEEQVYRRESAPWLVSSLASVSSVLDKLRD